MQGWTGKILRIDLTKRKIVTQEFDADFARTWLGGRGFAAKILIPLSRFYTQQTPECVRQ
jgi:aldehyde:ferredoxin oxidoreductase